MRRRRDAELDRLIAAAGRHQEQRGAIEECPAAVEPGAPDRKVECLDRCGDGQRPLAAANDPGTLVLLLDVLRACGVACLDGDDMPRKLPQQIAAGNPRRQRERLLCCGIIDPAFDDKMMPIGVGQLYGVINQNAFLSRSIAARDGWYRRSF
jgi:hypothetical protein